MNSLKDQPYWKSFVAAEQLTHVQQEQMERYITLLLDYNKHTNITAITGLEDIVSYHLQDSIALGHYVDFSAITAIADVGSGGGFPGIPLKIVYPHISVVLIEVNQKKIAFLESVIEHLGLTNIEVCPLDWRTFIRTSEYHIDLFCARASLQPEELVKIFGNEKWYADAIIVYWASQQWCPDKKVVPFLSTDIPYTVGTKERRFILFSGRPKKPAFLKG